MFQKGDIVAYRSSHYNPNPNNRYRLVCSVGVDHIYHIYLIENHSLDKFRNVTSLYELTSDIFRDEI